MFGRRTRSKRTGRSPLRALLLLKPGLTRGEPLPRLAGYEADAFPVQPVAQELEALRGSPDEGLVGVLLQPQLGERLVHDTDGPPQLPARGREHQDVVHEAHEEESRGFESCVQLAREERTQQRRQRAAERQPVRVAKQPAVQQSASADLA